MAEKGERNYQMNYYMCQRIVFQILDFATKLAHYKELTKGCVDDSNLKTKFQAVCPSSRLVPAKIVLDWKMLFISGRPLYDNNSIAALTEVPGEAGMGVDLNSSSITRSSLNTQHERSNDQLLNDLDFQEYKVTVQLTNPFQLDQHPKTIIYLQYP